MTDAEAVKNGYVSVSALDYSLNSEQLIASIETLINE